MKLPGEISPRLLSAVPEIQDFFRLWDDEEFRRVPVEVAARESADIERASGVACFFSGGVDAFYTLLKNLDEVTHLIFVHGFDIPLTHQSLRTRATRTVREVAEELGKPLVEVEANLRTFGKAPIDWGKYHGPVLASIALLFQHRFRKVLIPATFDYAHLVPWGSHPLLDPMWGTERMDFEHDGCEVTRPEKVAYISEYEIAMEGLRVCSKIRDNPYNCGRCGKCLMTMISLRAAGALERCKTFPSGLDLQAVANMDLSADGLPGDARRVHNRNNLKALERLGTEPELTRALAEAFAKSRGTSEVRSERAERELKQARAKLVELTATNQELEQHCSQLAAHYSSRRYKLADTLADNVLRMPGVEKLVRRKGTSTD